MIDALTLILGAVFGSFANVLIHRLPLDMNIAYPHSHCPACRHSIPWYQNIPIFSFIFLKGRCYFCSHKIPISYPMVEIISALGFVWAIDTHGLNALGILGCLFWFLLLCMSVIDCKHYLLPDELTLGGLWLALLISTQDSLRMVPAESAILGAVLGYFSVWSVYWIYKLLTQKEGMGYGDFKLLAFLGAFLGPQQLPGLILLSSSLGSIYGLSVIFILRQKTFHQPIPFGPFLALAGWLLFLYPKLLSPYL
ncbi:MAG: prepilin peptidase [Gammaproteobacteria bacterium]